MAQRIRYQSWRYSRAATTLVSSIPVPQELPVLHSLHSKAKKCAKIISWRLYGSVKCQFPAENESKHFDKMFDIYSINGNVAHLDGMKYTNVPLYEALLGTSSSQEVLDQFEHANAMRY